MKRIGMLTSGGDCQALNAAMRGVVKSLLNSGEQVEIYGFLDGYRGLIYSNFRMLTWADFSGILTKGGTILGSSRTPFKTIKDPDENGLDKVDAMLHNEDCQLHLFECVYHSSRIYGFGRGVWHFRRCFVYALRNR